MALTAAQKRASIRMLQPMLNEFSAAVAEMRIAGSTEAQIDEVIETAIANYPSGTDPELKQMMREAFKAAARPEHAAPPGTQ